MSDRTLELNRSTDIFKLQIYAYKTSHESTHGYDYFILESIIALSSHQVDHHPLGSTNNSPCRGLPFLVLPNRIR